MTIVKKCTCGAAYSVVQWEELVHVGIQPGDGDRRLDMRQCVCRTTLAREMPEDVSVCVCCGTWVDGGETKIVTPAGVQCSECGMRRVRCA